MGDNIPMAEAELIEQPGGLLQWVIAECPYCGQEHHHGAGRVGEEPIGGHRAAHCSGAFKPNDGYYLRPISHAEPVAAGQEAGA